MKTTSKDIKKEAVDYFALCQLSYKDIQEADIQVLYQFCIKHLKKAIANQTLGTATLRISRRLDISSKFDGTVTHAIVYVSSHLFANKIAIIMDYDRTITILPWSDKDEIAQPFCNAFIEWCDWIVATKKFINAK